MNVLLLIVSAVLFVVVVALVIALAGERGREPHAGQFEAHLAGVVDTLRAESTANLAHVVDTVVSVASDRLRSSVEAGWNHVESRNEVIGVHLDGMAAELRRVNHVVEILQRERAAQHGELVAGLRETAAQSRFVAQSTQSLRESLSSTKSRGQWGERMADDVLRLAGLHEGVNYVRQRTNAGGTVPDVTFLLPGSLELNMDVKFPLDNYKRFLETNDAASAQTAKVQFLRDARARVREVGGRGYIRPGETLDYLLLFIPNEAVYSFLHEQDSELADYALGQKVVLCSPFTLFAVLSVIRQAVDSFALQRSTNEIVDTLSAFTGQWDKFSESIDTVGKRLESTGKAFEELSGPRRRQMQRVIDKVDGLRVHRPALESVADAPFSAEVRSLSRPA